MVRRIGGSGAIIKALLKVWREDSQEEASWECDGDHGQVECSGMSLQGVRKVVAIVMAADGVRSGGCTLVRVASRHRDQIRQLQGDPIGSRKINTSLLMVLSRAGKPQARLVYTGNACLN